MKVSILSLLLLTLGVALLIGLFTVGAQSDDIYHAQFVLAFAIPGASLAYDRFQTAKSIMMGFIFAGVGGAVTLSIMILTGFYG